VPEFSEPQVDSLLTRSSPAKSVALEAFEVMRLWPEKQGQDVHYVSYLKGPQGILKEYM